MVEDKGATAADPEVAASQAEGADAAAQLAAAQAEIEQLRAQLRDQQLRGMAELENLRKRAERETAVGARFGAEKLAADLLGVCDSLELGLDAAAKPEATATSIGEGLDLTHKQLLAALERHGVSVVDPAGQPFNPEFHEAVSMVESADVAPNHVLTVLQKGYRLHERLLRPARVVVARAPATGS